MKLRRRTLRNFLEMPGSMRYRFQATTRVLVEVEGSLMSSFKIEIHSFRPSNLMASLLAVESLRYLFLRNMTTGEDLEPKKAMKIERLGTGGLARELLPLPLPTQEVTVQALITVQMLVLRDQRHRMLGGRIPEDLLSKGIKGLQEMDSLMMVMHLKTDRLGANSTSLRDIKTDREVVMIDKQEAMMAMDQEAMIIPAEDMITNLLDTETVIMANNKVIVKRLEDTAHTRLLGMIIKKTRLVGRNLVQEDLVKKTCQENNNTVTILILINNNPPLPSLILFLRLQRNDLNFNCSLELNQCKRLPLQQRRLRRNPILLEVRDL